MKNSMKYLLVGLLATATMSANAGERGLHTLDANGNLVAPLSFDEVAKQIKEAGKDQSKMKMIQGADAKEPAAQEQPSGIEALTQAGECQLPLAKSPEEAEALAIVSKMADDAAAEFYASKDTYTANLDKALGDYLKSLESVPEEEKSEELKSIISQIKALDPVSDEDLKAMSEKVKCSIINQAPSHVEMILSILPNIEYGKEYYAVAVFFTYFGGDLSIAFPWPVIKGHKYGPAGEFSLGFSMGVALKWNQGEKSPRTVISRRWVTGVASIGKATSQAKEKVFQPKLVVPLSLRTFIAPSPESSLPDFYGWYGVAGASTFDYGFFNLRVHGGIKLADIDETFNPMDSLVSPFSDEFSFMVGVAGTLGQQSGAYVGNVRVILYGNAPIVAELVQTMFSDETGTVK